MSWQAPAGTPRPWGRPVTVGILGGMGPYATLQFMKNVLDLTPAHKDWEHVRMVADVNCHIPSRTRAVLHDEASPLPGMIDSCHRLQEYPVDVIALPCNSAAHWLRELRRAVKTPILDIASLATAELLSRPGVRRVAALSGHVPWATDLYRAPVESRRGTYVKVSEAHQREVAATIEAVKSAGRVDAGSTASFHDLVRRLAGEYRLDGVILACTEFSLFAGGELPVPVVDSSAALAREVIAYAVRGKPLPLDTSAVRSFWEERAALIGSREAGILQSTMLTASEPEAAARWDEERSAFLAVVAPLLTGCRSVLELGCGTGRWTRVLAGLAGHVDAWDYCAGLVAVAEEESRRAGITNVRYGVSAVEDVAPGPAYDAVVSVALLHYLSEEQFLGAMQLVRASVAPGGHAIFRESFGVDRRFELHGFFSQTLGADYHAVYRTPAELHAQLGDRFELVTQQMTLRPTADKPETCQGLAIFRRAA